jgi:hypothetical protein
VEQIDLGGNENELASWGDGLPLAYGDFEGVDVLLVVDNSGSMKEEQQILATAVFPLVSALIDPLPGWPYPAADNLRIAVVSSDMGLSWGGNPYENGDGWPGDTPQGCGSTGDNGWFEAYTVGKTIDLMHDTIPCDASNSQCPAGWLCEEIGDEGVGTCHAPSSDGTNHPCPGMSAMWVETPIGPTDDPQPNEELATQVACLSSLGTSGCGFEQQLQAAAAALDKPEQADFVRDGALLAVIQISDEEDCSIESNDLFAVDEIQQLSGNKVNVACANHPQHLFAPTGYYDSILAAKNNVPGSAIFAAIVGVPIDDACQGAGHEIPGCLDHPNMQPLELQEGDTWMIQPACTRWVGDVLVTKGRPGRRFVELAQAFGPGGYVSSICNENWLLAAEDIATLIATRLEGACFPEQLPWDSSQQISSCHLFVEYQGWAVCPLPTDPEVEPIVELATDSSSNEYVRVLCPLPRLAVPLDCGQVPDHVSGIGWYYCENQVDDDDQLCPWVPRTTLAAQQLIQGRPAEIRCPIEP